MGIRSTLLAVLFAPVLCLGGCVSFSTGTPLYNRAEAVIDPTLLGVWGNEQMRLTINLAPNYGMCTRWEYFDDEAEGFDQSSVFLPTDFVPFGNYLLMFSYDMPHDYWRAEYGCSFIRLQRKSDFLEMSLLNPFAAHSMLRAEPLLLKHEVGSDEIPFRVLDGSGCTINQSMRVTATSDELRSFLIEHENDPDLFVHLPLLRRER